jgi:hypothetical protein
MESLRVTEGEELLSDPLRPILETHFWVGSSTSLLRFNDEKIQSVKRIPDCPAKRCSQRLCLSL